ncbi:MAG: hypothetical protein ACI4GY_09610 [Acutalibacteraceae bacterium]
MKKARKILAVLLCLTMIFSVSVTAFAADGEIQSNYFHKTLMNLTQKVVDCAVGAISSFYPTPKEWTNPDTDTGFMAGTEEFLSEPAENAAFCLGYDSRSILTDESSIIGKMYVGGSISLKSKFATSIVDDLRVRTAAVSDSSGRGISVFVVLDAYGLSLPDVREIRQSVSELSASKNINSITVSVLHQHSAVDTLGMNGNVFQMALINPAMIRSGKETTNGKNAAYMENLKLQCKQSIESAVNNMKQGKLFYGCADQTPYLIDKRAPFVSDSSFNRFRFVPDDGSKETWLVSTEIHCVGNGAAGTEITGDYPYYAEKEINEKANANVLFFMGAQQSTSQNRDENTVENYSEDMTRFEMTEGFGKSIGKALCAITEETEVAPLLNIRYKKVLLPISNQILLLAGKAGMFESLVVKNKDGVFVSTELGYIELGNDLAFAVIPGELAPELAYGGCLQKDKSWSGEDWSYPSMQQIVNDKAGQRTLKVIDLANDQIGYIIPDNNFIPMLAEESDSLELVSLGKNTASCLMDDFESLVDEIK